MARFKRTHSVAGRLMKKDIHPEYREVVFLDTSCNAKFLTRSTIETRETIEYQGKTYPLSKIEISSASHPVYTGDFIVVVNASKLSVTGNKWTGKTYYRHSGYPGGIYQTDFGKMQQRFPGRALEKAVKGMMPKNRLGRAMFAKLKVYPEMAHPHTAQQPQTLEL